MLEKFLTKDNIVIITVTAIMTAWFLVQSQYFATKVSLLELRNDVLKMKIELQTYSDNGDKEIMDRLDAKYEKILQKLDHLK